MMLFKYFGKASAVIKRTKILFSLELRANMHFNFLDGKRVNPKAAGKSLSKCNPATGRFMFDLPCSGEEDVIEAVRSAHAAFLCWSRKSPRERGQILIAAASKVRENLEEISIAEVKDTGKPIWEARVDTAGCADVLEYFGGVAATLSGSHHQLSGDSFCVVKREPLGVVAGIGAWNYPFQVMTWKVAPALVCGNTFVYKPSEFTPTSSVLLAEIFSSCGLPPGVLNIIQGDYQTGEHICQNKHVAKVTFTGSVETGKKIMKTCADTMKKVTMELGGKSALILFEDCDLENAVKATLLGNFLTQGEVCSNCTRVYVQEDICDVFIQKLVEATKNLKIGDPFDKDTKVGAIINEKHGEKILKFLEVAKKKKAHVACGGDRFFPADPSLRGFFVTPCVVTGVDETWAVARDEIFGPVVCVMPFDDEAEAVRRANESPFGLAGGVMTRDLQRAHRVAGALQAGIVWVNNYNVFPPEVPFGGYKMSGFGRENGTAALDHFSQLKTVYVEMESDLDCPLYT